MYNGFQAGGEASNNPFLNDSTPAHTRFPDISASTLSTPQAGYQSYDPGYHQQSQLQHQHSQLQQQQYPQFQGQAPYNQPQQFQQNQYASTSYSPGQLGPQPTGMPFQPSGPFGQQPPVDFQQPYQQYPNVYQNQYSQQQQQYGGYQAAYQPQQQTPSYLSEFDPYASRPTPSHNRSQSQPTSLAGSNPSGAMHPREYIRQHKAELEAWDSYTWKQMFNACDGLSAAWLTRKQEADRIVQQMGGDAAPGLFGTAPGYQGYASSELQRWKEIVKEANSNHDTTAASSFQLQEVYASYRQSADAVSKRRVRESCNAALTNLPEWPAPLNANQSW